MVKQLSIILIHSSINIVPQGSVKLIGYGKSINGPTPDPTNKPIIEYTYIYDLTEGSYSCDKNTPFSYLNLNKPLHCETQIANDHAMA
jgi:hypothetical protein